MQNIMVKCPVCDEDNVVYINDDKVVKEGKYSGNNFIILEKIKENIFSCEIIGECELCGHHFKKTKEVELF